MRPYSSFAVASDKRSAQTALAEASDSVPGRSHAQGGDNDKNSSEDFRMRLCFASFEMGGRFMLP